MRIYATIQSANLMRLDDSAASCLNLRLLLLPLVLPDNCWIESSDDR